MSYPDRKSRRLIEGIKAAFADVSQPVDQIIPGTCWCDECSGAQDWLGGKHWHQFLRKHAGDANNLEMDTCALNAEAWHFFLPALLIQRVKGGGTQAHDLDPSSASRRRFIYMDEAQWLIREESSRQHRKERFDLMTKRQCQVVQDYIRYVAGQSEAKSIETETTAKHPEIFAASREKHQKEYAALLDFWRMQEQTAAA